jgi:hypothetical protein
MIRKDLEKELEILNFNIDLTDFNSIERSLKYYLRFELGDSLANGTKQRVDQATNRASELFENYFHSNSQIYLIIYDFSDEMFAITPNYIYELLASKNVEIEQFDEELAIRSFEDEEIERVKGILTLAVAKVNEIRFRDIFNGIANTEMGFTPTIHQLVYFFEPESKKCFWMYNDRGCLMLSNQLSDLKDNLIKFKYWLVKNQKDDMEGQFK